MTIERKKKAKVISLTGHHLSTGDTPESVKNLLATLVQKSEKGEILGMAVSWTEGQNDIFSSTAFGSARYGDLVAGVSGLLHDLNAKWGNK